MADEVGARKRVSARGKTSQDTSSKSKQVEKPSTSREDVHKKLTDRTTIESSLIIDGGSYWLTRIVFVRALAFVYFVAFLVALNQNKELIGSNGLLPAPLYLDRVRNYVQSHAEPNSTSFLLLVEQAPTILWWVADEHLDLALDCIAYMGMGLSAMLMVLGAGNVFIFATLWVLYHSLVNVGQTWYSFGWESQLLETGFLAMFLCPVLNLRQFPRQTPTSLVVVWGYRWLIFRIMIGAGLIKLRGDQCWRDLTCMNYHYETQPVPNPLSYYLHQNPEFIHRLETAGNHFVELLVPFFMFLGRIPCALCGLLQILFQVILILSGNLSFLNWLTILPSIFCFDDRSLSWIFPQSSRKAVAVLQQEDLAGIKKSRGHFVRRVMSISLAILLGYLSIPVVQNLLSSRQAMNTSFDPLRILNTYGAFGSVTKQRTEVVIEGTYNTTLGENGQLAQWQEIEFNCKPGSIDRQPCVISPYHYRLDWLLWFSAFQNYQHNPWLIHFCAKVLAGDPVATSLVAHNPFHEKPPRYIRALHYKYEYTKIGSHDALEGHWWRRKLLSEYFPIVDKKSLLSIMSQQGWKWYSSKKEKHKKK